MKISLLGVKWDKYQCFRSGSIRGLDILRKALIANTTELNIYRPDWNINLYDTEVQDLGDIEPGDEAELVALTAEKLKLSQGLLVSLGGSHAISFGPVSVLKPENFVMIDAHSDLYPKDHHEPEWMKHDEDELSQENVAWCVSESGVKVHLYGQRVFAPEEEQYMKEKLIYKQI